MPDNKDFLNQFSNQGKPDSFKEEERVPVTKERKPINVKLLIGLAVLLLALGILAYFLFFAPKIVMPNFVGKTKTDVAAWTKQQGIEQSGILFEERYDFDTDEGVIISQNVSEGKKVKKNVKVDFVISLGADPDEKIKVPNIKSMDKNEIQDWISKNKLSKTRVITAYNENVEENEVIDYSFSGCDEDNFTRACTLKINVSKGPAPAGKITVEDFEKKLYESVETWAKSKKINLVKVEQYSDIIDKGYVISQSVPSGKTIDEGADFVVIVSLGKAITVPNFIGWDKENIIKWARKNAVSLDPEGGHDNDGRFEYDFSVEPVGSCIKQYPAPNTILKDGEAYVHIWLSKGHPNMEQFTGNTLDDLNKWVREVNIDSGNVDVVVETQLSEKHSPGEIIEISNSVMCNGTIYVTVSEGSNLFVTDLPKTETTKIEDVRNWLSTSNIKNFEFKYENNDSIDNGYLIKIIRSDTGKELKENTYLPETVTVLFIFCEK